MRQALVLAAGKGTRMKSKLPKVLHEVLGKSMVQHVIDNLRAADVQRIIVIIGHGAELVEQTIEGVEFVYQLEQLGTGHAVMQAEQLLMNETGTTMVICGDTPLIQSSTIAAMFEHHEQNQAKTTVLTTTMSEPTGYGRIIRDEHQQLAYIVEQKDANEQELAVQEINTGTYCFDNQALFNALGKIDNQNAQGEYYLTDVIQIMRQASERLEAYCIADDTETLGINDRLALAKATTLLRERLNNQHMINGVTLVDPATTYIGTDVVIGSDTIIYPGCVLLGQTVVGEECIIGPNTQLTNAVVGDETHVMQSVMSNSSVGAKSTVGPFAHLRQETACGDHVRIGNFVEMKKTSFANNAKASHLSYLGDSEVCENVNIGCGVVTVNYDGHNKNKTTIEANAFIGCNANLIAPVTIGEGVYVAAGSTVTKDVPADALAIARARQENKAGYAKQLRERFVAKK